MQSPATGFGGSPPELCFSHPPLFLAGLGWTRLHSSYLDICNGCTLVTFKPYFSSPEEGEGEGERERERKRRGEDRREGERKQNINYSEFLYLGEMAKEAPNVRSGLRAPLPLPATEPEGTGVGKDLTFQDWAI